MLEHAIAYARAGWRIMPLHHIGTDGFCTCRPTKPRPKAWQECPSPGKHPRIKTGRAFEAATTDEAQIQQWWGKWPKANIGIATGQRSRLCVVDIDGPEGFDTLRRLCEGAGDASGTLPITLTARSGRQGVGAHLYFTCEEPSPSNSGDGLDIRGNGGNLVAPPSMHISGQPYAWINSVAPAPMPAWLLHWFQNRDRETSPKRESPLRPANLPAHLQGRAGAVLSNRTAQADLPAIADVEAALEVIPNDNRSWDEYNRIGMAIWRATGGSDEGLDAFDYWAQKSLKYDPESPVERWRAYVGSPPDSIGYGSLWYEAKQADPAWTPPSAARSETIPLEMRAFSAAPFNRSFNDRSHVDLKVNAPHSNGEAGPTPQMFIQKVPDNPLNDLNDKFAVIGDIGGKCRVLGWTPSKVDPRVRVPSFQDFKAFSERFGARYIEVPIEKKNGDVEIEAKQLGAFWLKWTGRKSYEGIDLSPNSPPILEGNILNLWSGFAIAPRLGTWQRMQGHITDVLADGNAEAAGYILKFAAWCLQNPGKRAEVALVFRGEKGSGKGTFARALKDIFGQHGLHIFSAKHLTGNFNAHLRTCLLLFSDEAFWAGDKQGESTLKGLLTEPTMMIEQKGVDASPWKNRLKVIMAANNEWVVPAGPMERRYAVFNVSDKKVGNYAYFTKLNEELDSGGLAAMTHDLLSIDLHGWHPRDVVKTDALMEQKMQSMTPLQEWFCSLLDDGVIPGNPTDHTAAVSALLHTAQEGWARMKDVSPVSMGRFLRKHGCYAVHTARGTAWRFPALADLRKKWERAYGGAWAWEQDLSEWRIK